MICIFKIDNIKLNNTHSYRIMPHIPDLGKVIDDVVEFRNKTFWIY